MPSGHPLLLWLAFASQAAACLYCFSTHAQRHRVCQHFLGHQSPQHAACLKTLQTAFQPYTQIKVGECRPIERRARTEAASIHNPGVQEGYSPAPLLTSSTPWVSALTGPSPAAILSFPGVSELEKLKETFGRIIFFLEEKGLAKVSYRLAIPDAAQQLKKEVEQLSAAPACIPPCVVDVHKTEGEAVLFKCTVNFTLPSDTILKWRFAKELRSQYMSFFQDLHSGFSPSLLIQPILQSRHGTYACQISAEDDVLVRMFFYLNVTARNLGLQKDLQEMFRVILNPPPGMELEEVVEENNLPSLQELLSQPDYLHQKNVIFLIVGLALGSMLVTLVALVHGGLSEMKEEIETGVRFLSRLVKRDEKLDKEQVRRFGECLTTILCERFSDHWYPENPQKGQAYRCIRINRKQKVDDSLLKACKDCGLDYSKLSLPREISLWIDPGEVCCRLGENSYHFKVVNEPESNSGKATPEMETSDYHSESPSECSSEDEGPAKRLGTTPVPSKSQSKGNDNKQAPQYFYMPSPLWVPYSQVSYIPAYQPVTVYYVDYASKPPVARKPNPNLLKRLTKRASKV
ncbi:uncharacterized protein LOC128332743 isoform X3 [Hemicordylus capensis]|uniref:uncharacterized protein LOC128332743 isoform X3 n=1 Tax=Hemicordylus capensis TaxID=884348 RepID=UPI0023029D86|nr:uncharacterized protein LOC128332743 isoform X3 [Hemicordylus capensis]